MNCIDWNKKCLKSLYRDTEKQQFYIKVYDVLKTTPTGFANCVEPCFDCKCFEGQGFDTSRNYLRCSLIGVLYEIVDIPDKFKKKIFTIFDFIGE